MSTLAPLVKEMQLSAEQEKSLQAEGNVAVTAGAGTGKTRTLVARYLSLLARGLTPRQVVAITFTQKAAREMRNRVREGVRLYLERAGLAADESAHWQAVYDGLDAARIGTIHSLCAEILRHHPAQAHVDPRFEMLDEGQMALLKAQAVDAALAWAVDDAEAVQLFADWNERDLRTLVSHLLIQRLDVESTRTTPGREVWAHLWEPRLASTIGGFTDDERVKTCFDELLALRRDGTLDRADAAGDALAPLLHEMLCRWETILAARQEKDWSEIALQLSPLRQALKQKGRKGNWAPAEPKTIVKELQALYDDRLAVWTAPSGQVPPLDLDVDRRLADELVPRLLRIYDRALAHYAQAKQGRPALDFDDLEDGALRLLREHPPIRAYWQGLIRALLVDEFQDTNSRQRDLLDLIAAREDKLFIVGDGKQSIYRFRGADVTVFRQTRREIGARGETFELATSYRAHRALIEGLNGLLEPVLGAQEDPQRPYVEPFAPLFPSRHEPAFGLQPPFIEFHLALGTKSQGGLDRAARALVARLIQLVEGQPAAPKAASRDGSAQGRALTYGDIAILCRATRSFAAYENALDEAGVPFLTVAGRGFYERPEVRDVLNALRALSDPTNDLALAGLLRSPACALSDMALYRLVRARDERQAPSLWALLGEPDRTFLQDDAGLGARAYALIERLHGLVGHVPVADVLKAFLDLTAYRAVLLRAGQGRGARNVAKLLSDAHASGIVGVSAFIEYVEQLRDVGTREGEAHTVATGAVQVMSVHAAKGLEFPIVVIGDAGRDSVSVNGLLIDRELGVLPPLEEKRIVEGQVQKVTPAICRLARQNAQDQEDAESDRLLYVAATRAQEMLLISGVTGPSLRGWLKRLDCALPLADCIQNGDPESTTGQQVILWANGQPIACALYSPTAGVSMRSATIAQAAPRFLPQHLPLLHTLGPEPVASDAKARELALDPPRRVWRVAPKERATRAPAWVVGKIVHNALERWLFADWRAQDRATWVEAQAKECGLTEEWRVRDAVRRVEHILTRFQATSLYNRMAAAEQRFHELPYSVLGPQGKLENGVIDALFREGSHWTLVEFKTDDIRGPAQLEKMLQNEDYVPQVAAYLAAAERLLGVRPHPVLCLLNYAGNIHMVEDRW
jgi:ATP-dependent helicase/nuclease subunit A